MNGGFFVVLMTVMLGLCSFANEDNWADIPEFTTVSDRNTGFTPSANPVHDFFLSDENTEEDSDDSIAERQNEISEIVNGMKEEQEIYDEELEDAMLDAYIELNNAEKDFGENE